MVGKIYQVGGSVRDELLGIEAKDNDYVVVGSTKEEMIENGYSLVGNDFPVFLKNGEEYALARTEKSNGNGYHDFEVSFGPEVTIEEDLYRRDLTINAIAKDGIQYIDPYNGIQDINNRTLRMINPDCFVDDPVRILRLARFSAQFPSFKIDPSTIFASSKGDISQATAERVSKELEKALMAPKPSNFFNTLKLLRHLDCWFPEINKLIGQIQSIKWHAEGDAYSHTMMVLDSAARYNESLEVRFGCLVHDFGKGLTPKELLPKHHGHEKAGIIPVNEMCDRLKLSNSLRSAGVKSAEYHMHVHKDLNPKTYARIYDDLKNHYDIVARVGFHDKEGRLPYIPSNSKFSLLLNEISKVKLSNHYSDEEISKMSVGKIKSIISHLRRQSVRKFLDYE